MLINALHAIVIIIVLKVLMEIAMDIVYVKKGIMIINQIVYANNVLNFGYNKFIIIIIKNFIKFNLLT